MESVSPLTLENLTHFGLRAGVDMRPTLIRVLTDLYVQKLTHTPEEERHYTELALRLLDAVDAATRAAVAARLAHHLTPPYRVIKRLAADLPDVAAPVRAHPALRRKPQVLAPAVIAVPPTEPHEAEIPTLADFHVAELPALAELHQADVFARDEPAEEDGPAEEPVPADEAGNTLPADVASELNELFFAATAYERRLILLNLEIVAPSAAGSAEPARDAMVGQRLETAALARDHDDFAQHLAQALQIPRAQAQRIVGDELGEPIVTAAKALNIPRDVLYRILLFVNTTVGHSVERVHALATLYDEVPKQAAEQMVEVWQSLPGNERAVKKRSTAPHRPLPWNDEARARARTATATVRRAPSVQRPGARRDAS
jgi:hypothetical protein